MKPEVISVISVQRFQNNNIITTRNKLQHHSKQTTTYSRSFNLLRASALFMRYLRFPSLFLAQIASFLPRVFLTRSQLPRRRFFTPPSNSRFGSSHRSSCSFCILSSGFVLLLLELWIEPQEHFEAGSDFGQIGLSSFKKY